MYSRITGYYRPVQNWNDGKLQEFQDRKVYDASNSMLKHNFTVYEPTCCGDDGCDFAIPEEEKEILLFATKTCPNCAMAKSMLNREGVDYKLIDAEENKDLTIAYGIRKAPTLLVPNGEDYDRYDNASEIRRWLESR